MKRVTQPELKFLSCEALDMSWESIELVPETPVRSRGHGISRTRPALMSSSTSCRMLSSLPAAMSRFICSSHSSSFQPCNQAASSARSSNESRSIALWISAKLTDQLYRVAIVSAIVESSKESLATTLFVRMSNAFGSSKDNFAHLQSHVKLDEQWRRRLRNSAASRKQREPTAISTKGSLPKSVWQFSSNSSTMPLSND